MRYTGGDLALNNRQHLVYGIAWITDLLKDLFLQLLF